VSVYEDKADKDKKVVFEHEMVWHYWRRTGLNGEHKVFALYRLEKDGEHSYTKAEKLTNFTSKAIPCEGKEGFMVEITCPEVQEGDTLAAVLGFEQPLPDLANPNLTKFFRKMAHHANEVGADGIFSDEWGYDIILKIETPNPYDDFKLSIRHFSYSKYFEEEFQKIAGKSLIDNMLALFYNHDVDRKEIVDAYWRTIRLICTRNEDEMYAITKEELGKDAFWGIHPTWWGNATKQNFEFFKNGFYWWDAKRDIAQTDEMVSFPIRTALAHRFYSPLWYNMWYSMGTRSIGGYFPETWTNLRYGGRTHYLGYECPNEGVVLELKPRGLLEAIERMDKRVRLFDELTSQPDCRVLLFFGFEALSNYADYGQECPWVPENPRLIKVLDTCNKLFPKMLCDLVPSYSVENGSLFVNKDGKVQYGNQVYDVVIAMYPNRMTKEADAFLRKIDPKTLVVCDGKDFSDLGAQGAVILEDVPPVENLFYIAKELGAVENTIENGCVFQDGSVMFTTCDKEPTGNKLNIETILAGKKIVFHGEDALWVSQDGKKAIYPAGELWVNDVKIASER